MNNKDKTREGLIKELQELKHEYTTMKELFEKDKTELKQLEEALKFNRFLLDNTIDPVTCIDYNGRFIDVNDAFCSSVGYSREELLSLTIHDIDPQYPADKWSELWNKLKQVGSVILESSHRTKEGKLVFVEITVSSVEWNGKEYHCAVSRNITERKKAEELIKLKNEMLQTINAEKDKFFSILAHDLKGPLSAFMEATQILTEEIQNMTLEEIKEIIINMKESATNIYGLLLNLLEWSRLKRGMMDFTPEMLNVKQKITASTDVLTESARKKNIKINCDLPEDLEIYADSHMFETVILNLVSNAIKFTPKSGEISVSATATLDNIIEIKICDTGIGMDKELINRLFLLNEKTNRKGTEGEPSTGLGLLLCKEFIEKNGGKILVESEVEKGSIFSFTIPCCG